MRDKLPAKIRKYECGIVNLDDSANNGTHWIAYYNTPRRTIYFDSFGLDPPLEMQRYLGNTEILSSTFQLQEPDDYICGHLCLYVLQELSSRNFKDIILELYAHT